MADEGDGTQEVTALDRLTGTFDVPFYEFHGYPFFYTDLGLKPDTLPNGKTLRGGLHAEGQAVYLFVGERNYAVSMSLLVNAFIRAVQQAEEAERAKGGAA